MSDRQVICDIISEMLDNPDKYGIYPTTIAYDKLEKYVSDERTAAVGWMYAEACVLEEIGVSIQNYDISELIPRIDKELNR